jgi:aminopeptidase N
MPRPHCLTALPLSLVLLMSACQQVQTTADNDDIAHARPVADALDKVTADARDARISNVTYDARIDIASSEEEIAGELLIAFDLSDASSDLTLDFTGGTVDDAIFNGARVTVDYNGYYITIPAERLQLGANSIELAYRRPYGHDGSGLHRFVDPEDGLTYMHSYLWPYYANRLLPSFDQPSLKANFSLQVLAPKDWTVISTSPGTAEANSDDTRLWTFPKTPGISTYAFSLHAGAYKIWTDNSGDVPLRLMARQSLAEYVAVEEWFSGTQKGMTFYTDYFDIPYPFEKYDQLIVPEFNIGGMENVAAVTYSERYIQRQQSNRAQRESRAGTVLHELAHMWFGDLVTHAWWNGMWLNESFATQMATLAQVETTEFTDKWHGYFIESKTLAYYFDSRVTTHPIEMVVPSTDMFTTLFDAITYKKGGSALKQLQHRVGAENYRLGVSAYLKENSYSTTELSDFIGHQTQSSGIDLNDWADEWLLKTGFNTLATETDCESDVLRSLTITQTAPDDHPYLRTHEVEVGLYGFNADGALVVTQAIPVTVSGEHTAVEVPAGLACPVIVNPNYNDWTYAKIAISAADAAVLSEHLADIEDPLSRSMFLTAMYGKARAGDMSLAEYLRQALALVESEENIRVLQQITGSLAGTVHLMQRLSPETDRELPRLLDDIETLALKRAEFAATQDRKRLWLGLFLNVASSHAALGTSRALLDGRTDIDGIDISSDIRWRLLIILSRNDAPDIEELLEAEIARDPSDLGQRNLLSAKAAAPNLANKEYWVDELQTPKTVTNLAKQRAVMAELFPPTQTDLQLELLTKTLSALPQMSREADLYFMKRYGEQMLTTLCRRESSALMEATLEEFGDQLNPTALRYLREGHQADVECQALRAAQ